MIERITGSTWMATRERIFARDPLCRVCLPHGRVRPSTQCDHIVPLHQGGTNDDANLQGLCMWCHRLKTAHERGWLTRGADASGIPLDPDHPWNVRR